MQKIYMHQPIYMKNGEEILIYKIDARGWICLLELYVLDIWSSNSYAVVWRWGGALGSSKVVLWDQGHYDSIYGFVRGEQSQYTRLFHMGCLSTMLPCSQKALARHQDHSVTVNYTQS